MPNQFKSWLRSFSAPVRRKRRLPARPAMAAKVEMLESRQLLSADPIPLAVVINSPTSTAAGVSTITPSQVASVYGFTQSGANQTIAIVEAYRQPNLLTDVAAFSTAFGLQQFNVSGGPSLQVLNQAGGTTVTAGIDATGAWGRQTSMDVQWAHAMAPNANIIVVQANSNLDADIWAAVNTARGLAGVSVVSMSFGATDSSALQAAHDSTLKTPSGHSGVTFVAATGNAGTALYPAMSSNVVAVGGTSWGLNSSNAYTSEATWDDAFGATGSGVSATEARPGYQENITPLPAFRSAPDIAMMSTIKTSTGVVKGVPVYDSYDNGASTPWVGLGGTGLSASLFSAFIAGANQVRATYLAPLDGPSQLLPKLYFSASSNYNDITTGSTHVGGTVTSAGAGYDRATGFGTPTSNLTTTLGNYSPPLLYQNSTVQFPLGSPTPVTVNPKLTLADFSSSVVTDATLVQSATFSITNYVAGDTLAFTNVPATMGNITGSVSAGILTLTSAGHAATLSNWNAALKAVTYICTNTTSSVPTTPRTLAVAVYNGTSYSNTVSSSINLYGIVEPGAGTTYTALGSAVPISTDLVVVDTAYNLTSATVSFYAGTLYGHNYTYTNGNDFLTYTNTTGATGISGTFNNVTGVLTLVPSGPGVTSLPPSYFQAALRTVGYMDTTVGSSVYRAVSYHFYDTAVNSSTNTMQFVTITGGGPPVISLGSTSAISYTRGAAPVVVNSTVSVSDPGSLYLTSASLRIFAGFNAADVLSFVDTSYIHGSYVGDVLTLTCNPGYTSLPIALFASALNSITFSTSSGVGPRAFTFSVTDAQGQVASTNLLGAPQINVV
ncbi:S53 family peptidase [Schlesneria paludicola]|uniref:S53 family peptidase n=1 Tax=Schlesneria paludicola TaxID=360056 RepID=UPI00029B417B|nr:S53 family peptidase [Schlesneria paludicola]